MTGQPDALTELPRRPLSWSQWFYDALYRGTRSRAGLASAAQTAASPGSVVPRDDARVTFVLLHSYRALKLLQRAASGSSELERLCSGVRDVLVDAIQKDVLGDDDFDVADTAAADAVGKKLDRGLSVRLAETLYRLEVAAAVLDSTRADYELLVRAAEDGTPVAGIAEVVKSIFYKEYYRAPAKHGRIHLDLFTYCLNTAYRAQLHANEVLDLVDRPVSWETASEDFKAISDRVSLLPAEEAGRKGRHWTKLGFQGDDPSTDFRGTGELGLRHLRHLTAHHAMYANRMLAESGTVEAADKPEMPWYPFALCSIHVTFFLHRLARMGYLGRFLLRAQLRGGDGGVPEFLDELHGYLLCRAHLDWAQGVDKEEITTVLQFEDFFKEFAAMVVDQLARTRFDDEDFHIGACKWW